MDTFAATMDEALLIPDAAERQRIISALAKKWLDTDRMGFVAYLERVEVEDEMEAAGKFSRLLPALAEAFPQVSEAAAASPVYNDAVQKFVELWATAELPGAREWVERWLLGDARDQAVATLLAGIEDPTEARTLLDTIRQPYRRLEGTAAVAATLAAADPAAAFAWAASRSNPIEKNVAIERSLAAIAEADPVQAGQLLGRVTSEIAAEAAAALLAAAGRTPAEKRSGEGEIGRTATPEQRIAGDREQRYARLSGVAAEIAANWARQDSTAALAWAGSLPAGSLRSEAQGAVVSAIAERDPAAALLTYRSLPAVSSATATTIFELWGAEEPEVASAQLATLQDPESRVAAVSGLTIGWSESDSVAAEEWVTLLPAGAERDAALEALSRVVSESDPQAAWARAAEITAAETRQAALADVFPLLVAEDPTTAGGLLVKTDLPEATARLLRRQLDGATKTTR